MKMAPEDVLEEFITNASVYKSGGAGKLIAEREDFDVQIFLSGMQAEEGGGIYPVITVVASGDFLYEDYATDEDEFLEKLEEVYDKYLTSKIIGEITGESDPPPDDDDHTEEIELREKELECAVEDFLYIVYGEDPTVDRPDGESLIEELKDQMLLACSEIIGPEIYRPMVLDNAGGDIYEEYPYLT